MQVHIRVNLEVCKISPLVLPPATSAVYTTGMQFDKECERIPVTPLRETFAEAQKDMDEFIAKYGA